MDLPIGPSLLDFRAPNGQVIPALIQTTKMGQVFFLDRLTGAPIAAITEKPVRTDGATPGVRVSPTQPFSTGMPAASPPAPTEVATWGATPIDQLFCRIDIRRAQGTGIYQPMGLKPIIGHPAFDGVTDWGGAAVDPVRGVMTVNTMEMPFKLWLMRHDDPRVASLMKQKQGGENAMQAQLQTQYNTPYVAVVKAWVGIFGAPCVAPPWGHLTAVDLGTRKVLWKKVLGTARDTGLFGSHLGVPIKTGVPNLGGSIITAGGLAFIGATTDQYLRAFDLNTGEVVWKARLQAGAQATPMTYRGRDGRRCASSRQVATARSARATASTLWPSPYPRPDCRARNAMRLARIGTFGVLVSPSLEKAYVAILTHRPRRWPAGDHAAGGDRHRDPA
ncbi:hypothetical protein AB5I41_10265 [Sphingomonas sp. MMS24-JH45]